MDSDNIHGPITAVGGNTGSKPATPIAPPSPSSTPLPNSSIPPPVPSPSTLVTSHGPPIGRYGYGQPPMPPSSGQGQPGPAGSNQLHSATFHNSLQTNHSGPMGSHLHHSTGGYPGYSGPPPSGPPPPGHHHGQYIQMMMPPPSQYPNKPPPGMMSHASLPQQQPSSQHPHQPQGPQHISPDGRYANYGPPPSRMSGPPSAPSPGPPPPMHHGSNVQSQYYSMRHQMPPHQMMNKNYPYPSTNVGYGPPMAPNQNHPNPPMPPSSSASGHMPPHLQQQTPNHPMHHHHLHPHPHQPHPSQHPHQIPHVYGTPGHNSHGPEYHNSSNNVTTSSLTPSNSTTTSSMIGNNSSIGLVNASGTGRSTPNNINHHGNNSGSNGNIRLPQPPLIMDELSQTSTASSQAADDSCASSDNVQTPSHNKATHNSNPSAKHLLSHPPTPGTSNLGSPGAASLSSFHDDFDSVSSPSWPRTPASPSLNNSQYDSHIHNSKRPDNVQKLYEMSDEPERKIFLDKFFQFLDERGTQLNQVPTISKIPLDLFRLYIAVKERGGYLEVTRQKMWKDCALICKIANSSSASYTLRKQYMKHLLPFECKFDRGGIDVGPLLTSAESSNVNRKKSSQNKLTNSGRSTPNTPRLSPNDSPSSYPPHHPAHHSQMNPGYDQMDSSQTNAYPGNNNNASGSNNTTAPPYHHGPPPPPPSSQSAGPPYSQHPESYSQHNAQYGPSSTPGTPHASNSSQNQNLQANHESVSVKDPFSDEDVISTPRVSKSTTSNYPARNQHYSMPNNTVSYGYGPNGPQSAQSQTGPNHPPQQSQHPNNYPENIGPQYPPDPSGYPRSNSTAPSSDSTGGPSNSNTPYGSRMGMNGGMHGYFGQFQQQPPPPPSQQQQQPPPPQPSGPFEHPPSGHSQSRSYDHHGQHGYTSIPPGHRYPIPNNATGPPPHQSSGHVPGSYPNRLPPPGNNSSYPGQQSGPHSMHHGGNNAGAPQHQTSAPPPSGPPAQQPSYPLPNTPGSQDSTGTNYPNKNTDNYNQSAIRMQSPLAQRLLAAKLQTNSSAPTSTNQQTYPTNQQYSNSGQTGGGPSNKSQHTTPQSSAPPVHPAPPSSSASSMQANTNISWMSSQSVRYNQPKRHPDFAKQNEPYPPPPPPPPPGTSSYQPQTQSSYGSPGQSVPPRSMPPPPGSAPPNAVCPSSWNRENHQYRMPSGPGNYYHNNYPNSGQNSSAHQQREWHDSRTGPSHPPPPSAAPPQQPPSDSPMTTAHWSSNRYSNSGGGNYPPNEYSGQSQTTGHFPNTSGSSGHSNASAKMMPPQMPQYSGMRPEQPGTRSNYIMSGPPGGAQPPQPIYPPSNKMPGLPGSSNSMPNDSYSHYNAPGMGMQYGSLPPHQSGFLRRESLFPPNTVEATVPTPNKRRKLMARDIAPVEAWRLFMALKSGLLAESTYALDVLNVYSNDDNTLIYLSLPNMPGLLEVLLEHYRRYLNEMFDNVFENIDNENENKRSSLINGNLNTEPKRTRQLKWYELDSDLIDKENTTKDEIDEDIELFLDKNFKLNGQKQLTLFDSGRNYTNITRNGKTVKIKKDKNLLMADHKEWDQSGKNNEMNISNHIQSHMEPKKKYLRFCRLIKSAKQNNCDDGSDINADNSFKANILMNGNTDNVQQNNDTLMECENENEFPKIHPTDRERYWNKIHQPDFEDESYDQEEPAVCTGGEYHDSIKSRCLTVSNLIRNLTFVPGNDLEMCKNSSLLFILSRLILLHHVHAVKKKRKITEIDCTKISANKLDEETMFNLTEDNVENKTMADQKELQEKEWWWESLHLIRENTMVTLANISGQLDLSIFPESIALTLLDGLLHWAVCPSSYAQDAFPSAPNTLSPRRLAYEALSKLSIYEFNVDLILATPPWSRIEKFLNNLTCSLVRNEDQTTREFSIVLISNFANADPSVVRVLALSSYSVSLLLGFIEQAEHSALNTANTHGIQYLRENFDSIGTTPDMVRRAAAILRTLARYNENHSLFIQHEQRLLSLSMSQILDNSISSIIADILYECSFEPSNLSHSVSSTSSSMANNGNKLMSNKIRSKSKIN